MTKIAVLVGSIRKASFNQTLARSLQVAAPEGVSFEYVDIAHLPLFSQDVEHTAYPASAQAAKDIVAASDGVLFVTPEYNRSFTGVLKNAIDWLSRPYGTNSFEGKPAGVVGASGSKLGTAFAQAHLRTVLLYLNMHVMGQPELYVMSVHEQFDDEGKPNDELHEHLTNYMTAFINYIEKHN